MNDRVYYGYVSVFAVLATAWALFLFSLVMVS
jgi:hypothetical protein